MGKLNGVINIWPIKIGESGVVIEWSTQTGAIWGVILVNGIG